MNAEGGIPAERGEVGGDDPVRVVAVHHPRRAPAQKPPQGKERPGAQVTAELELAVVQP